MKTILRFAFLLTFATAMFAQQAAKPPQSSSAKSDASDSQETVYKLNFAIYELQDGKRINQRDYTMFARTNTASSSIHVSTRVPVYSEEKQMHYVDAGLSLRSSIKDDAPGKLQASFDIEISNFVLADQVPNGLSNPSSPNAPILRTINTQTRSSLTVGKPLVVASIDDVNSKKRMQVEVTAIRAD